MKKSALFIIILFLYGTAFAQSYAPYFTEIVPVTSTYQAKLEDGIVNFERSDISRKNTAMSFSGTSTCNVVDLSSKDINGYFVFQFKSITGVTAYTAAVAGLPPGVSASPVSGTTISVHWRGSNVDSNGAWAEATKTTLINGINAYSGATNIGYDMNVINGVTPFKYIRFEFESGVSNEFSGKGNLVPVGVLFAR